MPVGTIEREIHDAYVRLARSAATARRCHEQYLDDLGGPPGLAAVTWPTVTWPTVTWPTVTWPTVTWPTVRAWPAVTWSAP